MGPSSSLHSAADLAWGGVEEPRTLEVDPDTSLVLREVIAKELTDKARLLRELVGGPFDRIKDETSGKMLTESTLAEDINILSSVYWKLA